VIKKQNIKKKALLAALAKDTETNNLKAAQRLPSSYLIRNSLSDNFFIISDLESEPYLLALTTPFFLII
jgi:hypothetical protein